MNTPGHVVGVGVVTPAGSTVDTMWSNLTTATGTLGEVIRYDELDLEIVGCRAQGFTPEDRYPQHELRRLDRAHQMAYWAADDAHHELEPIAPDRTAVVIGVGYGAAAFAEHQYQTLRDKGWRGVSPLTIPVVMPNSIAAHLSLRYGYTGPSITVAAACASGAMAIGEALWLLRTNRADRVLCGGVDALHTPAITAFFHRMDAMSKNTTNPTAASRPFSADRDGFVLGEGAGMLIIDRHQLSSTHGAIIGYHTNNDSHHLVAPDPTGNGAQACMLAAIRDAGLAPADIGHINAHGTGTQLNDQVEAHAITNTFGPETPVFAPKATIGHLVGGAGAVETIISLETLRQHLIPPTQNYTAGAPEIPDGFASTAARPQAHGVGLTNSFAFGGTNATMVLRRASP